MNENNYYEDATIDDDEITCAVLAIVTPQLPQFKGEETVKQINSECGSLICLDKDVAKECGSL